MNTEPEATPRDAVDRPPPKQPSALGFLLVIGVLLALLIAIAVLGAKLFEGLYGGGGGGDDRPRDDSRTEAPEREPGADGYLRRVDRERLEQERAALEVRRDAIERRMRGTANREARNDLGAQLAEVETRLEEIATRLRR